MMKNYFTPILKSTVLLTILILSSVSAYGQLRVPFTQRTSQYTPNKVIYNVKGDFTMIGNSNLTLQNYGTNTNNSNNSMVFIDEDNDQNTSNSSSATLSFSTENGANPECSNIIYAGLYWTGRGSSSLTEQQMRTVKFKGPNDTNYSTLTATTGNIRYPGDNNMYAGYIEVTDKVRNNGIGEYYVADIAISEGNGGTTGYYGGWGMIVVYENSKMNWRDVTIFDGYAYVQGNTSQSYEIPVSGFNAVQMGDVNIKLGMMAGEGDRGISGDYFQIIHADEVNNTNPSNNDWETLSHSGNSTNNFFNSSINTGGNARSPSLVNNTGLDIAMFNLDNSDKSLIDNSQTQTRFRYGSNQDTYVIFNMAMSVDAYIPESEGVLSTTTINGSPPSDDLTAEPGDIIEYKIEIKNKGTEPILDAQLVVPIPFTSEFVPGSISYGAYLPAFAADPPYFDPNMGATGSIVWDINFLPLFPSDINLLLADISFQLKATEDCTLLLNDNCEPKIVIVGGSISGTGMISRTQYTLPLIQSYQSDGICQGEPNTDPIEIDIIAEQYIAENCTNVTLERDFIYCSLEGNHIEISELESEFPPGTRFYNAYPVTPSSTEYTNSNPFPATLGVSTYYGVPPGDYGCHYEFTIEVSEINSLPTVNNVVYCQNETASALTGQSSNPDYVVVYFADNNPNTSGQLSLIPDTSQAGTFTYYASEGPSEQCVNTERTPITVTVYSEISIVLENLENVACYNGNSGSIDISVSGGSGNYTYDWNYNGTESPNTDPQDINNLASGTYTVTVNDSNNSCYATASFNISQPTQALTSTITSTTDVLCYGDNTGEIDLTISGGTAPYSILWNNGATSEDLSNLSAGTYNVTISDANGCSTTSQATINQPANSLTSSITNTINVDCKNGTDGSFTVNASGGTSPYQYSIDNGSTNQNSGLFENLSAGTYNVLITDANNCTINSQAIITEPDKIKVSVTNVNNIECSGEATGDISISVNGGTQPYTYAWNNSTTSQNLTDVIAGTYSVTITDANGCTASISATITEPSSPLNINISKADANTAHSCSNGEATVYVSGGTAPYTYAWSASASNQTTSTASNLPVGSHSVTVTDANGCELTQSIVIDCVNTCDAEITIENITNILCAGDNTGSGTVSASSISNPNATFTFTWSNGQIDTGVTSSTINNLTTGVYDVSVTIDGTACQPVEETISIIEPSNPLNLTVSSTDELGPNTNDGTASASAAGGTEPYTYLWSPGGETSQNISGLSSGTYSVTVTDANGCTQTATVNVNPGSCQNLAFSVTSSHVSCNDGNNGSITATAINGVGPFTYSWDSLPDTTPNVNNLSAGNYTVTVTDQTTLCTQSTTITINEPNALSSGIAVTNILCKGDNTGSVDLTVNGGTPPYSYIWNNGATSEDLINVVAGTYSVTITDANGCETTNQSTVQEPSETVSASIIDVTNVDCTGEANGSISVEASGGIPPYIYSIDNGNTNQSSGIFENLASGNYTILITDANGCTTSVSDSVEIEDTENPTISVPSEILIEGCSASDITSSNAVFEFNEFGSNDVQSIFNSNNNYNASDDFNIENIVYTDVITSNNNCPIVVTRTFTVKDTCGNSATATQTITIQDTTPPTISAPDDITIECGQDIPEISDIVQSESVINSSNYSATNSEYSVTAWFKPSNSSDYLPRNIVIPNNLGFGVEGNISGDSGELGANSSGTEVIRVDFDVPQLYINVTFGWKNPNEDAYITFYNNNQQVGSTKRHYGGNDSVNNPILFNTDNGEAFDRVEFSAPYGPSDSGHDYLIHTITFKKVAPEFEAATGQDTCGLVTISGSDSETATACGNTRTIIRTWTATDSCGNSVSANQTITVVDTTAPTFTVPADITIECDVDPSDLSITGDVTDEADNCSDGLDATYTDSVANGSCANESVITRTWTLTDECNNTTTLVQTITVEDTTAPTFTVPADITIECDVDPSDLSITGDVTDEADNCSTGLEATYTDSVANGSCANESVITRTWTLTDECNNTTTLVQTITVQDTTAPTFTVPADITIECDVDPSDLSITGDVADEADNCSTDLDATYTDSVANGSCANESVITRTWTLTDECNNTTTLVQTITVEDTTAPTFTVPADITIECDVNPSDLSITGDVTDEADNCSTGLDATYTDSVANGSCANESVITRTWTLTDECNNTTTLVQTITVEDTTPPSIDTINKEDIVIQCGVSPDNALDTWLSNNAGATATDNCGTITWSNDYGINTNVDCANGEIIVTFTATDVCGNASNTTATYSIIDTVDPVLTIPQDVTIECTESTEPSNTGNASATDDCTEPNITFNDSEVANCGNTKIITRTWTATDSCGNSVSANQTITVVDTTAPTFTVPADITIECDVDPSDLSITGDVTDEADNCSTGLEATYTDSVANGSCANESVITRTWTLTDECDNTTTLVQTITVEDTTAPTFTVPADITIECDVDPSDLSITGDITDEADNCSTGLEATYTDSVANGSCANESVITRTWTLTDECNNTTTLVQTITVQDTTAPTFTVPADITIECDVDPSDLSITGDVADEADNCSTDLDATYTDSVANGSCANESVITRTWTLTDECNNTTTLVQTITVQDTTAPTFTVPADITIECDVDPSDLSITGDVTDEADNCSDGLDATYTDSVANGSCANESVITRTWTLTDECNNTTTLVQTITVEDTTAPTFTVPADITIECDVDPSDLSITGDVTDEADNCSTGLEATYTDSVANGSCANESVITRTWTLTDECNNTTTLVQTITVQDTTAPTFTVPADITIECDVDPSDLSITGDVADEADNCSTDLDATYTDSVANGSCANESVITRTWTLTDECNNTTTLVQTITVEDTTAPTFTVPADITIECDVNPSDLSITGDVTDEADNCSTGLDATYTDSVANGSCANESVITRTWTLTDECNNTTTLVQTITVEDTTPPSIDTINKEDIVIQCGVSPDNALDTWLSNNAGATATDNCGTITWSNDYGINTNVDCANGEIIVTFTATDVCGNASNTTATYSIIDTVDPVLTIPQDVTIECTESTEPSNTGNASATDDCTEPNITFNDSEVANCGNTKIITRTWTATDSCGNSVSANQTITVVDTTAPTFTVPADITIECDVDPSDLSITGDVTDEADNCSTGLEATYTDSVANGSCANESVITRTWTLTDECDNTTTLVQTITVEDTTAPTFTVPADITIECDVDPSDLSITGDITDEADNCSTGLEATYTDSVANGSCANESVITRTWTLTDECNNTTTLVQTITVQDTTAPTFTVPADITIECDVDPSDLSITGDVTDEADNCSTGLEATYTDSVANGSCANESVITRTWTLTDECDNTTTLVQTITVEDTTAPTFTVPADITIECDVDPSDLSITGDVTDEADNCSTGLEATYTDSVANGSCANESVITRTWTLADECNNTTTLVQTITVEDTTAPTFNEALPTDVTVECDAVPTAETLTANDNCGGATVNFEEEITNSTCDNSYILTRIWTAADACGNETVHSQSITVQDTTAPTFNEALPTDVTVECDAVPTAETLSANDNCGDATVTFEEEITNSTCDNSYILTRIWTAADACGNETVHSQSITVQDTTAPTFNEALPTDVTVECDAVPTAETLSANDNCGDATVTFEEEITNSTCDNSYTLTRIWTAADACGNETVHSQSITVQDTTAPTFNEALPTDVTVECDAVPTAETLSANDNCGDATVTFEEEITNSTCDNSYTLTRTWTAADACGNETVHSQSITVQDTTAPTFNEALPTDVTVECDAVPTAETLTANDNCGDATVTFEEEITNSTCDNSYTLTRTWTAADACGNETVHSQSITVEDTTAPTFNEALPTDVTVECDAVPTAETLTANDNCGDATVTFEEEITNGACVGDYIIERTWIASDACGNETLHIQIITVQDTTAPTLLTPLDDNITAYCDDVPGIPELVFEDSCSNNISVSFNEDSNQSNELEDYSIVRTWTVTDDCGNVATFTQNINVEISNTITAFDANRCILDSEFDLFELLSGDYSTDGTWTVVSGDAIIDGSVFDPSSVDVGIYTFMYSITESACPAEVEVNVTIDDDCVVLPCGAEDVVISKTVTANGDSFNEFFTISGVEDCGFVVELQIFNRWGAEIYKNNNYQNDWNGDAHGSSVGNSGKVPTGTYYYIINLKNSGLKPFAGPIYVATDK